MATRPVHKYEPIDDSQIHLLTIDLHDQGIVRCQLKTYKRETAPEYDAISYTWGEEGDTSNIDCDGFDLSIRTKLFVDLKYLKEYTPQPRSPIWIDAICIYSDRSRIKHCRNLGVKTLFSERFLFACIVGLVLTHGLVWAPLGWFGRFYCGYYYLTS